MPARPLPPLEPSTGAAGSLAQAVGLKAKERAHLADYLGLLHASEQRLVRAFEQVRETHPHTPDVHGECTLFANWARESAAALEPFIAEYGERVEGEPERLDEALLVQRTENGLQPAARPP